MQSEEQAFEMENLLNSIGWLLSIATVAGNAVVVFVVARYQQLHSSANWFVLSLAVADCGAGPRGAKEWLT